MSLISDLKRDFSISAAVAGTIASLIGYTSTGALVFAACKALGGTQADATSWMWALGWGMGLSCLIPSLRTRLPVLAAWSTPAAAVIISSTDGFTMAQGVGAFLICGVLIFLSGATGAFERVLNRIPMAIASALLAGILVRFGLSVFSALGSTTALIVVMLAAHLIGRRFWPRYGIAGVLLAGFAIVAAQGEFNAAALSFSFATPKWTTPEFSWSAFINLAIPMFLVTMLSQNMPGIAAMRAAKVDAPISNAIATTGFFTFILAPFGAFTVNLAAITAAIVMSDEAHPDPKRRYIAACVSGLFYCLVGTFGAVVAGLFAAFPTVFISTLAGLALLGTLGNSLHGALADESEREAALITFLVAASGVTLLGIGSAFWAVVLGLIARVVLKKTA